MAGKKGLSGRSSYEICCFICIICAHTLICSVLYTLLSPWRFSRSCIISSTSFIFDIMTLILWASTTLFTLFGLQSLWWAAFSIVYRTLPFPRPKICSCLWVWMKTLTDLHPHDYLPSSLVLIIYISNVVVFCDGKLFSPHSMATVNVPKQKIGTILQWSGEIWCKLVFKIAYVWEPTIGVPLFGYLMRYQH